MTASYASLLAIFGMALATYATRVLGVLLLSRYQPGAIVQAALDSLPVAVLTAVIAPAVLSGGKPDLIAAAITAAAAFRLPLLLTVVIGVASVIALRAAMN